MKVLYEEMFPSEFRKAIKKQPLAYLPLGAMEWHDEYNVLGLDSLKANKICQLAAEKTGGIVLPTLSLGYDLYPNLDKIKYPNKTYDTYHIEPKDYQNILEQYFKDIFSTGFNKLFVLAGHYPNKDIAKLAAKRFTNQKIWVYTEADIADKLGDHAGKWETSLMSVLYPKLVDSNNVNADKEYGKKALEKILKNIESVVR